MTEEAVFTPVGKRDTVEFRDYAEHILASVSIKGTFESAPNIGFGPLVRYISGENRDRTQLAMTAPVFHEATHDSSHTISFVLPHETRHVPIPVRTGVSTHTVPAMTVAVQRFAGGWSEQRARRVEAQLRQRLQEWGVSIVGPALFARYDPPWKPGFLRRNEVLIPINRNDIPTS